MRNPSELEELVAKHFERFGVVAKYQEKWGDFRPEWTLYNAKDEVEAIVEEKESDDADIFKKIMLPIDSVGAQKLQIAQTIEPQKKIKSQVKRARRQLEPSSDTFPTLVVVSGSFCRHEEVCDALFGQMNYKIGKTLDGKTELTVQRELDGSFMPSKVTNVHSRFPSAVAIAEAGNHEWIKWVNSEYEAFENNWIAVHGIDFDLDNFEKFDACWKNHQNQHYPELDLHSLDDVKMTYYMNPYADRSWPESLIARYSTVYREVRVNGDQYQIKCEDCSLKEP